MDYLDIKSSSTRDMLAARGSSLLVICPGIHTLVIGKANAKKPVCIPHCIAYATSTDHPTHMGVDLQEPSTSGASSDAIEEVSQSLRLQSMLHKHRAKKSANVGPLTEPSADCCRIDWVSVAEKETEKGRWREPRCMVGEAALSTHPEDCYELVWPLRALKGRPLQRIKDDLEKIWREVLHSQQGVKPSELAGMAAVLVLPDTYEAPLVRLLVDVVLTGLGCSAVVIHLEPAAAAFGQGVTSTCLLHIGMGSSWVCCVEDGCVLPNSRITLPYGQHHMAMALLCMLRAATGFPTKDQLDPYQRPCDWWLLQRLLMTHALLPMEGETSMVEQQVQDAGAAEVMVHAGEGTKEEQGVRVVLGPLACVTPMSMFVPQAFKDLGISLSSREVEAGRMPSALWDVETVSPQEQHYAVLLAASRPDVQQHPGPNYFSDLVPGDEQQQQQQEAEEASGQRVLGVDEAILRSIRGSAGSVEQKLRLFQSIVVSGPGGGLKGCTDMLERRVLHCLPEEETDVEVVAVLEPREDPRFLTWRGGVVLGVMDVRDGWVTREEWQAGGAKIGRPSKMARSDNPNARLFYYCRAQQGL